MKEGLFAKRTSVEKREQEKKPYPKFIRIEYLRHSESGKTKVWQVIAREDNCLLGHIKWYANWRQYAFYDDSDYECVFEKTCLRDIANFCEVATGLHNWQKIPSEAKTE